MYTCKKGIRTNSSVQSTYPARNIATNARIMVTSTTAIEMVAAVLSVLSDSPVGDTAASTITNGLHSSS